MYTSIYYHWVIQFAEDNLSLGGFGAVKQLTFGMRFPSSFRPALKKGSVTNDAAHHISSIKKKTILEISQFLNPTEIHWTIY